jgi:hypothetical protein
MDIRTNSKAARVPVNSENLKSSLSVERTIKIK